MGGSSAEIAFDLIHSRRGVSRSWMRLQPLIDLLDELLVEKSRFVTLFPMPTM